jgi:hypothetical protein
MVLKCDGKTDQQEGQVYGKIRERTPYSTRGAALVAADKIEGKLV